MTTIKAPPKECEQCGELFKIREKEGYDDWITRRFCSAPFTCRHEKKVFRRGTSSCKTQSLRVRPAAA